MPQTCSAPGNVWRINGGAGRSILPGNKTSLVPSMSIALRCSTGVRESAMVSFVRCGGTDNTAAPSRNATGSKVRSILPSDA